MYAPADFQAGRVPPKGWDVADAHRDGWSKTDIENFMRATVRPWNPEPPAPPTPDPEPEPPRPDPTPPRPDPRPLPQARPFDELMHAARNLGETDIEGLEQIISEARCYSGARLEMILKAVKTATKTSLSTLRAMLSGDDEPVSAVDHLALARLSIEAVGAENIICAGPFVWMWSDAGVWKQRDDRMVKQSVQRTVEANGVPVSSSLVNGVTDVLKTEIFRPDHEFNLGEVETVNCLNGQIVPDGDGWRLEPHCRDHYRTTQIPVAFDPDARAPRFEAYLDEVFEPDRDREEKKAALLEMMGYTLMSHALHEQFVILIGEGSNGKSVLLTVLENLCGPKNTAGVQPSNFDRSFQRAHLDQKLANIVTEIKQGEVIADAELKGITSGERTTVEHKFQDPFDMHPFATCWFGTNHMPHTRDFSDALFRRALILTFRRVFAPHEKDPMLKVKLREELPGILNLALAAYRRACMVGFTSPASSEEAKDQWRLEADQVAMFVEEKCTRSERGRIAVSEIFAEYQAWAKQSGISKTVTLKSLRDRLTKLGFGSARDGRGRYVTGIDLGSPDLDDRSGW